MTSADTTPRPKRLDPHPFRPDQRTPELCQPPCHLPEDVDLHTVADIEAHHNATRGAA